MSREVRVCLQRPSEKKKNSLGLELFRKKIFSILEFENFYVKFYGFNTYINNKLTYSSYLELGKFPFFFFVCTP